MKKYVLGFGAGLALVCSGAQACAPDIKFNYSYLDAGYFHTSQDDLSGGDGYQVGEVTR